MVAFTFKHGDRPLQGYEIQRGVGRGGFGEVYYAISDGGREVALKFLREHPEVELRGIAQCINLKSPHLVSIFDVKQNEDGEYFVVMEYISGPSLRDMLVAEPGGLGVQKAAFFVREIAKGLAYLHDRGIVHRDLKPGNIFYDEGYVKICDYGLSKFISMSRHSAQTTSIGTVHYMAPEVGSGNYSKKIDIYALGVILYEMLLGRVPYEGASMGEILMKHLTQQPEVDQLPQPFAQVIRKALAKDPAERYEDVNHMVDSIFDVEDVKRSVIGFEPASLTMVAARVVGDVRPSPVPSDNPAGAEQPAARPRRRGAGSGADFSRRFVDRTVGLDVRMTKKERRQSRRQERKRRRQKTRPELLGKDHNEADLLRSSYHIGAGRRLGRIIAATFVALGLSGGIGLAAGDPELFGVSFAIIMTSLVGIGIGVKVADWLGPDHPQFMRRLFVLLFSSPAALIVYGAIQEGGVGSARLGPGVGNLFLVLLAALALFDWRDRIRSGAAGDFAVWSPLWHGFLAMIGTTILLKKQGNFNSAAGYWMGAVVGSISLSLQSFGWAMIRNPLRADGEDIDEHEGLDAEESPAAAPAVSGGAAPGEFRGDALAAGGGARTDFLREGGGRRSKALRLIAGSLALVSAMGVLTLSLLMGFGEFDVVVDDFMGAIVSIVALSLSTLFWLGTTRRSKRVGVWNEWLNPILRVAAGTAVATGISGIALQSPNDMPGFILLLVMSSVVFLLLLILRGGKVRQAARRDHGVDRGAGGSGDSGGYRRTAPPRRPERERNSDDHDPLSGSGAGISARGAGASENDFIIPAIHEKTLASSIAAHESNDWPRRCVRGWHWILNPGLIIACLFLALNSAGLFGRFPFNFCGPWRGFDGHVAVWCAFGLIVAAVCTATSKRSRGNRRN